MVSARFYVLSFVMIFLFFGLGIIIGNSLGGQWVDDSYQHVLAKLEERLTRLSLEKAGLEEELRRTRKSQRELNRAWLSFFQERFGSDFARKKGILIHPKAPEEWVNALKEMGLSLEVISDLEEVRWSEADYLILCQTGEGLPSSWAGQKLPPALPVVLIGGQIPPVQAGHDFLVVPELPQSARDMIALVEGIQLLLKNHGAVSETLPKGGREGR